MRVFSLLILMMFLGCGTVLHSQEKYDYLKKAGLDAPIFRGELAELYDYPIEGIVYAYSETFEKGDIIFNGKPYYGVMLNLNSHRDELQLQVGEGGLNIALRKSLVGDFTIGSRHFTALCGDKAISGLKEGYYEVLYRGEVLLLKRHYKMVTEKNDNTRGVYKMSFISKQKYYIVRDGKAKGMRKGKVNDFLRIKGKEEEL